MDATNLIGNLTFWAGKLLILVIFVMIWWSLPAWDFWVWLGVTLFMIAGAYVGIKLGMKDVEKMRQEGRL